MGKIESLLTLREQQVMELVAQGLTNKEIRNKLFIAKGTLDKHLAHIYNKYKVRSANNTDAGTLRLKLVLKHFELEGLL